MAATGKEAAMGGGAFIDAFWAERRAGRMRYKTGNAAMSMLFLAVMLSFSAISCVSFVSRGLSFGESSVTADRYYFEERVWVSKFLGSSAGSTLVNVSQRNNDFLVAEACHKAMLRLGGIGVEDVMVVHEASVGCILLNALTLGIYAPSEIVVSGYVLVPRLSADAASDKAQ